MSAFLNGSGTRKPVEPRVVRAGAVVCDSTESEDLPPVPPMKEVGGLPFRTLRTRLSLQVLGTSGKGLELDPQPLASTSKNPTLTPRADWHDREIQWAGSKTSSTSTPKKVYQWTTNIDEVEPFEDDDSSQPDFTRSFFYKPPTPPKRPGYETSSTDGSKGTGPKRQASIKSLRAHLLKGVMAAKSISSSSIPPVPAIPAAYKTPPRTVGQPIFAISSPGTVDAGLPGRELVLEGEEWEGKSYESRKDKAKKLKRKSSLRRS